LLHVVILHRLDGDGCVAMATKQLYASHYFEASTELLVLVRGAAGGPVLVQLVRSRADQPRGRFYWFERALLERHVRRLMRNEITRIARRVSQPAAWAGRRHPLPQRP
jgi:hypothetical protein